VTPLQIKAQQVKASFADQGIPVSEWADQNGYRRSDVYRVLNGFTACKRGLPHEIAVKLGLKPNPAKTSA
jgi:gp16 family phage-associated protein